MIDTVEVTKEDVEALARETCGNWKKFESFGWHSKPEDPGNWTIMYPCIKDSSITQTVNGEILCEEMQKFEDDVMVQSHKHWASGWLTALCVRVYEKKNPSKVTGAFKRLCEFMFTLHEDCTCLDEDRFNEACRAQSLDNIRWIVGDMVKDDAPEDWPEKLLDKMLDEEEELQRSEDDSYWPEDELCVRYLKDLGLAKEESGRFRF